MRLYDLATKALGSDSRAAKFLDLLGDKIGRAAEIFGEAQDPVAAVIGEGKDIANSAVNELSETNGIEFGDQAMLSEIVNYATVVATLLQIVVQENIAREAHRVVTHWGPNQIGYHGNSTAAPQPALSSRVYYQVDIFNPIIVREQIVSTPAYLGPASGVPGNQRASRTPPPASSSRVFELSGAVEAPGFAGVSTGDSSSGGGGTRTVFIPASTKAVFSLSVNNLTPINWKVRGTSVWHPPGSRVKPTHTVTPTELGFQIG